MTIPLAWLFDALTYTQLLIVAFLTGTLTVFFEVAYQSYMPVLIGREHLVDGNSKLETSRAVALIGGPGLAGLLIQLLGAPLAVLIDALSFLGSGAVIRRIRKSEPPIDRAARRPMQAEIGEGLGFIVRHPLLRPIAGCTGTSNLFNSAFVAIFILFATRELELSAGWIGLIFAFGSAGFLLGALGTQRINDRIGVGPTIIVGITGASLAQIIVPFASGPKLVLVLTLVLVMMVTSVSGAVYNITQVSLRQTITPDRLLGRMNATMRFIVWGVMPIGGLLGGFLGELLGLRQTLLVCALGGSLAILWPLFSDVRSLREQPRSEEIPTPAATSRAD
jgi:predicted MFS family arabinose efflux permease